MQMAISKLPSLNGFWTQDFDIPKQAKPTEEILDGKRYQVFLLKKSALFPTQTGTLELDPAEAKGVARIVQQVRRRMSDLFDPFGNGTLMMNDPVFIETNQAMARRLVTEAKTQPERFALLFKLCLSRPPNAHEVSSLTQLYTETLTAYRADPAEATKMATDPLGPTPKDTDIAELAAWTTISNVVMNLDEFLMRR